eukprot:5473286-Heterocapsa_arctica.AAC.1
MASGMIDDLVQQDISQDRAIPDWEILVERGTPQDSLSQYCCDGATSYLTSILCAHVSQRTVAHRSR